MKHTIAQLRHAYTQLVHGHMGNPKTFADGLIAPAIRDLEKIDAAENEIQQAALKVCHAWRDNAAESNAKTVKALTDPIAELGMALARRTSNAR